MKLSIITINYNDKEGLKRTLDSVSFQHSRDLEHIIIDGGSVDGSCEVMKLYEAANRCFYKIITISEKDKGVYDAMNKGISYASGDYCIFMNSGDSFYDEFVIERFFEMYPKADIISGVCCEHVENRSRLWYPPKEEELSLRWFYRHSLSHQATFIRTSLMKELMYDIQYRIVSDWKFFMESLLVKRCSYVRIELKVCHYMDGGVSRNAEKAFAERENVIKTLFGDRILRDFHSMEYGINEWDALSKKVDYKSKTGKLIYKITQFLLYCRR